MKTFAQILTMALFIALPATGMGADVKGTQTEKQVQEKTGEESYLDQLKRLIDELTASGEDTTETGKQLAQGAKIWLKEDLKKIGDWEYKQLTIQLTEIDKMEEQLNTLGTDRWNCFWVQAHRNKLHLLFKRPAVSYLHKIANIDILKLISAGAGGESE